MTRSSTVVVYVALLALAASSARASSDIAAAPPPTAAKMRALAEDAEFPSSAAALPPAKGDDTYLPPAGAVDAAPLSSTDDGPKRRRANPATCEELGGRRLPGSSKCFIIPPDTRRSWWDAEQHCAEQFGGHLASIMSHQENKFVHDLYTDQIGDSTFLWIGLSKANEHGRWLWNDGLWKWWTADFYNWSPGMPDDSGLCAVMWPLDDKWDDQNCNTITNAFVCAVRVESTCAEVGGKAAGPDCLFIPDRASPENSNEICHMYGGGAAAAPVFASERNRAHYELQCDEACRALQVCERRIDPVCAHFDGVWLNDKCYFVLGESNNWNSAYAKCESHGGALASLTSDTENDVAYGLFERSGVQHARGAMWIGYSRSTASSPWSWVNGAPADAYTNWDWGNRGSSGDCAVMWLEHRRWDDQPCSWTRPALCEAPRAAACLDSGGHAYGGKCYSLPTPKASVDARAVHGHPANWIADGISHDYESVILFNYAYVIISTPRSFGSATMICSGLGGRMVSVADDGISVVRNTAAAASMWVNESSWMPSQRMCAALEDTGSWEYMSCAEKRPTACKLQMDPEGESWCNSISGTFNRESQKCFFSPVATGSRAFCRSICMERDATLASIHFDSDNDIVYDFYAKLSRDYEGAMFIGYSRIADLDKNDTSSANVGVGFSWDDDLRLNMLEWAQGQPVDDEMCVAMVDDKKWASHSCEARTRCMCSRYFGVVDPTVTLSRGHQLFPTDV